MARDKNIPTEELLNNLKLDLEWAEANEWETPICLVDDLQQAIDFLERIKFE